MGAVKTEKYEKIIIKEILSNDKIFSIRFLLEPLRSVLGTLEIGSRPENLHLSLAKIVKTHKKAIWRRKKLCKKSIHTIAHTHTDAVGLQQQWKILLRRKTKFFKQSKSSLAGDSGAVHTLSVCCCWFGSIASREENREINGVRKETLM